MDGHLAMNAAATPRGKASASRGDNQEEEVTAEGYAQSPQPQRGSSSQEDVQKKWERDFADRQQLEHEHDAVEVHSGEDKGVRATSPSLLGPSVSVSSCVSSCSSSSSSSTSVALNGKDDKWTTALVRENEQLHLQVADLSGALKARDLEIAALQERCQYLLTAIQQQDETIAKIYAVASPDTMDVLEITELPVSTHTADTKANSSVPAPPQATAATVNATRPVECTRKPSAKPCEPRTPSKKTSSTASTGGPRHGNEGGILNAAIDRILKSSPPTKRPKQAPTRHDCPLGRRLSLFSDVSTTETSPTSSCMSKSSSARGLERHENSTSEEEAVKSAGFLRRVPSRHLSGRLSITDFGLLEDDDESLDEEDCDVDDDDKEPEPTVRRCMSTNSDQTPRRSRAVSSGSKSATKLRSGSLRNLFADIDRVSEARSQAASACDASDGGSRPSTNQEDDDDGSEMTYAEFLERIRLPASRDIFETIRMFLGSILGPRGDGKPPRHADFVEYDFYGMHEFRRRCKYFFENMEEMLLHHPVWRHVSDDTLAVARDGIEKYVMDKLSVIAMNELNECREWKEEDERLLRRMTLLQFITPDMLDIKPCMRNEVVWSMAEDELRRINSFRSPGDKINCIVRCCSIIFSVLNLSRGESGSRPGADDFLPVFIYIVLHSKIPRLYSNCEYISAYRNSADLMSKAGYCFVNLRSAIEFITVADGSMLSISDDCFTRLYREQERQLDTLALAE